MLSLLFFSLFLFFGVFISSSWLFLCLYLPVMVFLWTIHFYSPFNSFYLINWFSHLDSLSCGLCLLTTWIIIMIVLCRYGVEFNNIKDNLFLLVVTFLFFVLLMCFITTNYLIFYIFFWNFFNSNLNINSWLRVPAWAAAGCAIFNNIYYVWLFTSINYNCNILQL